MRIRSSARLASAWAATSAATAALSPTEEEYLSVPSSASARSSLRFLTSRPHVAGTDGDRLMAEFVSERFVELGVPDVSTFDLDVLLNYPASRPRVALLSTASNESGGVGEEEEVLYEARLSEDVLAFDDTSDTPWRNHTFHGYSPSGDVAAPAVYANYGRPEDFAALSDAGVDVSGKVVIVRYGECFRGLKVMNAQHRGAVAVLVYSDPADDGYAQGAVYPKGPWRSPSSVQRGSVQFNSLCSGDPRRADARYDQTVEEICGVNEYRDLIPKIPSVPIGYGDALPLLERLGGKAARDVGGDDFVGGLDMEYTVGPSTDAVVRVVVDNRDEVRAVPNVVGRIPGTLGQDEDMPVLLGNHRDAWVFGAADPNSGTAALLEVARGLGRLVRGGWRPLRTMFLLSWSGEEYGMLGSTGWAELNRGPIRRAVAYLNVDTAVSGDLLTAAATPALATAFEHVLCDVSQTEHRVEFGNAPRGLVVDANANRPMNDPDVGTLGSGSDYTVFLDHLGIASLDFSFRKSPNYGVYHSVYDSFAWMDAYGGVDGQAGSAFDLMAYTAKIWGVLALRLSDSVILPFDHVVQGESLLHYTNSIRDQNCRLELDELEKAVAMYQHAAKVLHSVCERGGTANRSKCNEKLGLTERQFLAEQGLPNRLWFKHVLQAPGLYLGYAAEAFPGIQQAINDGDLNLAQEQVGVVTERVKAAVEFMAVDDQMIMG